MTTISYHFETPTRIMLSAASAHAVGHAAKATTQVLSREDMEERRWQLEWDRRNVED